MTKQQREDLEAMIDKATLEDVLYLLSGICFDKSRHLAENWSDYVTAKAWDRAAAKLNQVANTVAIKGVSIK